MFPEQKAAASRLNAMPFAAFLQADAANPGKRHYMLQATGSRCYFGNCCRALCGLPFYPGKHVLSLCSGKLPACCHACASSARCPCARPATTTMVCLLPPDLGAYKACTPELALFCASCFCLLLAHYVKMPCAHQSLNIHLEDI